MKRDVPIDAARGLAIALMVFANLSPHLLEPPSPLWFRLLESLPAPVFVLLAGMMVGLQARGPKAKGAGSISLRAALVLVTAVAIDALIHRVQPGVTFDVLYLIAVALPATWAYTRVHPGWARWAIVAVVVVAGELLRWRFGYTIDLYGDEVADRSLGDVAGHWLWDGWFPVFPWLGFALVGASFAQWRTDAEAAQIRIGERVTLVLVVLGAAWWAVQPGPAHVRSGYSELFYSPEPSFLLLAGAAAVGLVLGLDRIGAARGLAPLAVLGEASMFCYVAHLAIGRFVLQDLFDELPLPQYVLLAGGVVVLLAAIGWGLRGVRGVWPRRPMVVKFLVG